MNYTFFGIIITRSEALLFGITSTPPLSIPTSNPSSNKYLVLNVYLINFVDIQNSVMTEVIIIDNPSEKTLKFLEMVKAKKYADQEKLAEMKEFTYTINV